MEKVIYRTIQKKDYPQVQNLICNSFGLDRYVSDARALEIIKKRYLSSSLAEQTFNCVAEIDGQVVGVIMGASKQDNHKVFHLGQTMASLFYTISLVLFHAKACKGQGSIHKAYEELIRGRKKQYDGVLTLFIVQDTFRGLGLGKELLKRIRTYWNSMGTRHSYLYTDDTCNYGFYEHMGFTCAARTEVTILRCGKEENMDVYLYEDHGEENA